MLQEYLREEPRGGKPEGNLGLGLTICFICEDALAIYQETSQRGLRTSIPFVGNAMWVTFLTDPNGYRIDFESPTDAPEESLYDAPVST